MCYCATTYSSTVQIQMLMFNFLERNLQHNWIVWFLFFFLIFVSSAVDRAVRAFDAYVRNNNCLHGTLCVLVITLPDGANLVLCGSEFVCLPFYSALCSCYWINSVSEVKVGAMHERKYHRDFD